MPCQDDYFDLWGDGPQAFYNLAPGKAGHREVEGGSVDLVAVDIGHHQIEQD